MVLIVSADPADRERLRRCLPPGTAVRVASTRAEAVDVLHASTDALGVEVASGVRLLPDGGLVAESEVTLTPLEYAMLQCLLSPPGSVWSLLALSEKVWGTSFVGDGSQVRAVVKRLRRKVLAAGADLQIESVRGRGLRVAPGVRAQQSHDCPTTAPEDLLPGGSYGT